MDNNEFWNIMAELRGTPLNEYFGEHLKHLRQEKELSQKEVAKKTGVAVSTYANWEQGRRTPSIDDIFKILFALETEPNDLFDLQAYAEIARKKKAEKQ